MAHQLGLGLLRGDHDHVRTHETMGCPHSPPPLPHPIPITALFAIKSTLAMQGPLHIAITVPALFIALQFSIPEEGC